MSKFLLRLPNWIGDAVMATPLLEAIKLSFPMAHLTVLAALSVADVVRGNPYIDELIEFSRSKGNREDLGFDLSKRLKKEKFDISINLPTSISSNFLFSRSGIKRRIGYKSFFSTFLLTDKVAKKTGQHQIDIFLQLLYPLGIFLPQLKPKLFLIPGEEQSTRSFLDRLGIKEGQRLIVINPGAAYGSAKCWPKERFRELALRFVNLDNQPNIVFIGTGAMQDEIEEMITGLSPKVINLAGKTSIRTLMGIISQADLVISNDSGPMHMASALRRPLIAIFGSTDQRFTGPYYGETVIDKKVACSPCFKRTCPIDFRCMKQIEVSDVFIQSLRYIEGSYSTCGR